MRFTEIAQLSAAAPGVTLEQRDDALVMRLENAGGTGMMTCYALFPGVTLAYIRIHAREWPAPEIPAGNAAGNGAGMGSLLLNYCVNGRCEIHLNDNAYVYVEGGALSLTERYAKETYVYPSRLYEGLEFFIDRTAMSQEAPWIQEQFGLDLQALVQRYCPGGTTYVAGADVVAGPILHRLWTADRLPQMRVLAIELLQALEREPAAARTATYYTRSQVDIAKRAEAILTADLRQHHPARELATQFGVSETSLKNYFHGVYGQNISAYMQGVRARQAAALLTDTRMSVSDIAREVGYLNQSKFAAVFKAAYGMSPMEYRRSQHLHGDLHDTKDGSSTAIPIDIR